MSLIGKNILITAGPTYEPIDPVRFIGNHSSGKMGYAIVNELVAQGASVTLVTGPTALLPNDNATVVSVRSAQEMYEAVMAALPVQDVIILSAAVADYTPKMYSSQKIKKNEDEMFIELVKTKDIAKEVGLLKSNNQLTVGFALETNDEEANANKKMISKNLDFIVLNSMKNEGTCFGGDNNKITIIESSKTTDFEVKTKTEVAVDIVNYLNEKINEKFN
jgi:phosphopantothenoylcysteine decarboxylase/phosphopantothenate--cysteine ligase